MPGKEKHYLKRPPCPDPELYIWVETKEGGYWRLKKKKNSPLNSSFSANSLAMKVVSPAAKRIREQLEEYIRTLATGRLQGRLSQLLSKTYQVKGLLDFSALKGFEFQKDYPLERLLLTQYQVNPAPGFIELQIQVKNGVIKKHNTLVTDFYFEGILLHGDALKEASLEVAYAVSKPYSFSDTLKEYCKLTLLLPKQNEPWMLILKVSCLEGNEMAAHVKHYGMRVVEVSG